MLYTRDVETKSACNLTKEGLYKYATHPTTDMLCVAYAFDDGPIKLWKPGDPVPAEVKEAARNKECIAVAHNAPFEIAIERFILGPRYGWPIFPTERNRCTMSDAYALALPGSLEKLALALGLRHQKDLVGHRIMLKLTQPRKPKKGVEDPNGLYWEENEMSLRLLYKYCKDDVAAGREIAYSIPPLIDQEHVIWVLDQKINNKGLFIDEALTTSAEQIIVEAAEYISKRLHELTDGSVTSPGQRDRIKKWLEMHLGEELPDLTQGTVETLLQNEDAPEAVTAMLELRQLGAQAAPKKIKALISRMEDDCRVRGAFVYHAAGTGRWSSRGAQLHNMKRSQTEDIEAAIKVIRKGSFKQAMKAYDQPLAVVGDIVRATVSAPPSYALIGADFSGIEARVTAWLADEKRALEAFVAYDEGHGPDPYIIAAAEIFDLDANDLAKRFKAGDVKAKEQRQLGKAGVLAFGFGGGVNAYKRFLPDNIKLSDEQLEEIKNAWRKAHPNIVKLWGAVRQSTYSVLRDGRDTDCGKLFFYKGPRSVGMTLPSGRSLIYPDMRWEQGFKTATGLWVPSKIFKREVARADGSKETIEVSAPWYVVMKDNAGGRWSDVTWWFGITIENAVQAIARDLLAEAMIRIDKAGLTIVGHVHDECIIEVKAKDVEKVLPKFQELMTTLPEWAQGLPVVAHAWTNDRYTK